MGYTALALDMYVNGKRDDHPADALDVPNIINPDMLASLKRPEMPAGALNPDKICQVIAALQPEGAIVVEEAVTTSFMYYPVTSGVPPFSLLTLTGGAISRARHAQWARACIPCKRYGQRQEKG
jgi:hypothetical protein